MVPGTTSDGRSVSLDRVVLITPTFDRHGSRGEVVLHFLSGLGASRLDGTPSTEARR